jgi:hypothetical protein
MTCHYHLSLKHFRVRAIALISTMLVACLIPLMAVGQQSVARKWNEALLFAVSNDLARPTIHARNLFHLSAAMYDAWAVYDEVAEPYLIGKTVHGFTSPFNGVSMPMDVQAAREEALSYACYRLLRHRFINSPGAVASYQYFDSLMNALGYPTTVTSVDYSTGSPAHFGNHIASTYIQYGHQDGSNEQLGYANQYYQPWNNPLAPQAPGNPDCIDANRWQRLSLSAFIDQAGNVIAGGTPPFLSPEWGLVAPFSMTEDDLTVQQRDGHDWWVYHDPGAPCLMDTGNVGAESELYKWNFILVSIWQSHLDTADGVMWDISPASMGNIQSYPTSMYDYQDFHDLIAGGDPGQGYEVNPVTGQPYAPQWVKRGDYARVLAEFWADGPNSYTPPGHWFEILNHVGDHPLFEKRYMGEGEVLDGLEWDVKSYFTLGGGVHDAAVTAWGIKGYYDYLRPISAIRYMAGLGQSSDPEYPNYHPAGLPLIPGYIEIVEEDDPMAVDSVELVGKIKLYTWRGHEFIEDTETDMAGVGWILAERWWPYQRPSFVTPPFAGYISGHSTFSRTAAEIMTLLTGTPYFPGGMSELLAPQNDFLEFEQGPSTDVILQWATYQDASDQCSLSRIWGGIHPPMDDIPGRHIGMVLGPQAFDFAKAHFGIGLVTDVERLQHSELSVYPNPTDAVAMVTVSNMKGVGQLELFDINGRRVSGQGVVLHGGAQMVAMDVSDVPAGLYVVRISADGEMQTARLAVTH